VKKLFAVLFLSAVTLGTIEAQGNCPPGCSPKGNGCRYGQLGFYRCSVNLSCYQDLECNSACACDVRYVSTDICTCRLSVTYVFGQCQATGQACGFGPAEFVPNASLVPQNLKEFLALFHFRSITPAIYQRVYEPWAKIEQCRRANKEYPIL